MQRHGGVDLRIMVAGVLGCLRFFSRLPLPRFAWEKAPHEAPDFAAMPRYVPVAGAILGAVAGLVLAVGLWLKLGPQVSAVLAVAALVITTGALHEDGLADAADGLFGGASRDQRLAIMKDSRIGTYGAIALTLSLLLRVALITALAGRVGVGAAAATLVIAGSVSRTAGLLPLAALPPARTNGLSAAVGRPSAQAMTLAAVLAVTISVLFGVMANLPTSGLGLGLAAAAWAALGITQLARAKVGGQTGDIAGAAQQVAEVAFLLGLLIGLALEPIAGA